MNGGSERKENKMAMNEMKNKNERISVERVSNSSPQSMYRFDCMQSKGRPNLLEGNRTKTKLELGKEKEIFGTHIKMI